MEAVTESHPEFYNSNYLFPNEVWVDIKKYKGIYQISNYGRVKSLDRIRRNGNKSYYIQRGAMKKLMVGKGRYAYYKVHLYKDNKRRFVLVHRLVGIHFLPGPIKETINHKDGIKLNNHYSNLEWATYSENSQHAHDNGLANPCRGEDHYNAKLTDDKVRQIKKMLLSGTSQKKIAELFEMGRGPIQRIAENKSWTHV